MQKKSKKWFKKLYCEQAFVLCETSLVLKKEFSVDVKKIPVLKIGKAILKELRNHKRKLILCPLPK